MASPAAVLSVLVDVNSRRAASELSRVQRVLHQTGATADQTGRSTGRASKGIAGLERPARRTSASLGTLAKRALEVVAAFEGFRIAEEAVKQVAELGHATERLSAVTGLDAKQASTWIETMKVRGVQTKQVALSFITLSRNIRNAEGGSKTARTAFEQLGISTKGLAHQSTEDTLLAVAQGLSKIQQPAERAALAQTLFGRAAQGLIPVLAQGKKGVEEALGATQRYGAFLPKNVKNINQAIEAQRGLSLAADGLKISFATAVLPTLVKAAQAVLGFVVQMRNGQGIGGQFAAIISQAFDRVKAAVLAVGPIIQTVFEEFRAGNPAVRAVVFTVGGLVVALKAATAAQAAFDAVAGLNPYVAVAVAVAALVAALVVLYQKNKGVHDFVVNAWASIRSVAQAVFPVVARDATAAFNVIRSVAQAVFPPLRTLVVATFTILKIQANLLLAVFQVVFDILKPLVLGVFSAIKASVRNVLIPAFDAIKGPLGTLGGVFKTVWGGIHTAVKGAMDFILNAFATFLHVVADVAGVKLPFLGKVFGNASDSIRHAADQVDNLKNQLDGLPAKKSSEVDVKVNFLSNVAGAISSIATTIKNVGANVAHHYTGGLVTTPGYFAGEEAPQHPEVILATNPAYRSRNLGLWAQAGQMLGVPGFAQGGLSNAGQVVGQVDPWAGKTAAKWMAPKAKAWIKSQFPSSAAGSFGYLEGLWGKAGGPGGVAAIAAAIALAESGGNPLAHNPSGASGLWQILGQLVPGNIFNPMVNAENAVAKFRGAHNSFTPWVTYTNGAYKQFLRSGGAATVGGALGVGGGLGSFDGLPVASWIVPELMYAQQHGWRGRITSGYRGGFDPFAPSGSEHARTAYPGGAVDFGGMVDPAGLANKLAFMAATGGYKGLRLLPAQGFRDDGHMSGTGHFRGGIHGKVPHFARGGIFGKVRGFARGGINFGKFLPKGVHVGANFYASPRRSGGSLPSATSILGLPPLPKLPGNVPTTIAGARGVAATISGSRAQIAGLEQSFGAIDQFYSLSAGGSFTNPDTGQRDEKAIAERIHQLNVLIAYRERIFALWSNVVALTDRLIRANVNVVAGLRDKLENAKAAGRRLRDTLAHISTKGLKGQALQSANRRIRDTKTAITANDKLVGDTSGDISKLLGNTAAARGDLVSATGDRQSAWISLQGLLRDKFSVAGTVAQAASSAIDTTTGVGGALDNSPVTDSATVQALTQLLTQANQRTAVSEAQFGVLSKLPFGGSFAQGGIVPGPIGSPSVIVAHGGEAVGGAPQVNITFGNGMEWLRQFVQVEVSQAGRGSSRTARRQLPGSTGR